MVSLLGDYHYEFPMPFTLETRLKDYLEDDVDEKYYLSERAIEGMENSRYRITKNKIQNANDICYSICSRDYKDPKCIQVGTLEGGKWGKMHDIARRYYDTGGIAPTIHTVGGGNLEPKIMVAEQIAWQFQPMDRDYNIKGKQREERFEMRSDKISNAILTNAIKNCIAEPICLKSKVNGKQPSLQDRIYSVGGTSTAITQAFMPSIAIP
jgi:hypothetical protein